MALKSAPTGGRAAAREQHREEGQHEEKLEQGVARRDHAGVDAEIGKEGATRAQAKQIFLRNGEKLRDQPSGDPEHRRQQWRHDSKAKPMVGLARVERDDQPRETGREGHDERLRPQRGEL